jgi:hypothetical protein
MAVSERPPDDSSGEYSPRQMLSRADARPGPTFRGDDAHVKMREMSPQQMMIYSEDNEEQWIQSSCYINRGNIR